MLKTKVSGSGGAIIMGSQNLVMIFTFITLLLCLTFCSTTSGFDIISSDLNLMDNERGYHEELEDQEDFRRVIRPNSRIHRRNIRFGPHAHAKSVEKSVHNFEPPENYSIHEPPRFGTKNVTAVDVTVLIFSVRDIKELDEEISVEMRLQVFWKDNRLGDWAQVPGNNSYRVLNTQILKKIWYPDLYVDYAKKLTKPQLLQEPASLKIYRDGRLRYSTRLIITMSCPMHFKYYPADTQKCNVDVKSYAYKDDIIRVRWEGGNDSLQYVKPALELANFDLALAPMDYSQVRTKSNSTYIGIRFTIILKRQIAFHLIQTYLPSALFVIVSWLSFLVPPESVPGRMAICMTTLLTLTAMFSAVRTNVPKVSYIKALDTWMVVCAFFVFLALLEYTIVLKLRSKIPAKPPQAPIIINSTRPSSAGILSDTVVNASGVVTARKSVDASKLDTNNHRPSEYQLPVNLVDGIFGPPPKPCKYTKLAKAAEKYTWMALIVLFVIFNLIYWPWLMSASHYNDPHDDTEYYPDDLSEPMLILPNPKTK